MSDPSLLNAHDPSRGIATVICEPPRGDIAGSDAHERPELEPIGDEADQAAIGGESVKSFTKRCSTHVGTNEGAGRGLRLIRSRVCAARSWIFTPISCPSAGQTSRTGTATEDGCRSITAHRVAPAC